MAYTWRFKTGGRPTTPAVKRCHRGPMLDIERRMKRPFVTFLALEDIRVRLLENIVDTHLWAVRTREAILRTLDSDLAPMFTALNRAKAELQVLICEKRHTTSIDAVTRELDPVCLGKLELFLAHEIPEQHVNTLAAALGSNSPIQRVAARCAIVLLATQIEFAEGT